MSNLLVLGASLGNCVHVAGVMHFLQLAEQEGYQTHFLGPAVPVPDLLEAIQTEKPELVAVSYRLTPEVAKALFAELQEGLETRSLTGVRMALGCTPPVAEVARQYPLFEAVFTGLEPVGETLRYLRGGAEVAPEEVWGQTLLERIASKRPYPLLRHHFGQPTVAATVEGARLIAQAGALDVLSLGPDQNAQEFFFHPGRMRPELDGAGGVAIRSAEDLRAIYEATRCGNYPLLRIYAGTNDLLRWAELAVETIHNAWGAIPLFWYSTLDGRSERPLAQAIAEHQQVMAWYAEHDLPVECNDSHQWSMREAPDTVAVAAAYLGAYMAKAMGVRTYVAQYMFNSPAATTGAMDLGKMLAKIDLIESLHDDSFTSLRQTRAGLLSFSPQPHFAKGQLAASTVLALALQPQICHVVGYSEGDHASTAEELIESCAIVDGVIHNNLEGAPDLTCDPRVQERRRQLVQEASQLLEAIASLGSGTEDPLTEPETLARAVELGLLDAPHLAGRPGGLGQVATHAVEGRIEAVDPDSGAVIPERERIARVLNTQ
jgi:hypothetical protein